ncbi:MAG TPA: hypothetical protein VJ376_11210, partial [Pseudomonadota bacterium]|nr:hypothetical protein [Pseudomonadota bacterium]
MTNRRDLLKLTVALPLSSGVLPRAVDRVRAQESRPQESRPQESHVPYAWPTRAITVFIALAAVVARFSGAGSQVSYMDGPEFA